MHICTLASSSSGNCTLVSAGDTHILIDAGISMRRIEKELNKNGLSCRDISGILVTHEHTDHICGVKMMQKHYKTPLIMPETVARDVEELVPETVGNIARVPVGEGFDFGDLHIKCFHTPHDTPESVGYKITDGHRTFALATDLGHISAEVLRELDRGRTAILEANHDIEMLKCGPYPYYLKKRIASDSGHLSNKMCGKLAERLYTEGTGKIILAHLSRKNNTPELAYRSATDALGQSGGEPGKNVELYVAPCDCCGPVIEV